MRKALALWMAWLLLAACGPAAHAEQAGFETAGRVRDGLPELTIRVSDTGERQEDALREHTLRVQIEAQDGSFAQELTYRSSELPQQEHLALFARLEDVNFDGFGDLLLLTAQGARNVFFAVAVWNEEAGRFNPVEQTEAWDGESRRLSGTEVEQLELCNHELDPESRCVLSGVNDGFFYYTLTAYCWESRYGQVVRAVWDVYDAGEGLIGESLVLHGTGVTLCWDEQYPESWYYGQEGVYAERSRSAREMITGRASWDPTYLRVANTDWVNLRRQDSTDSPSLAKLDAGTEVVLLADGIGTDEGWVRVYVPADAPPDGTQAGLTGYIWHSFLEPAI